MTEDLFVDAELSEDTPDVIVDDSIGNDTKENDLFYFVRMSNQDTKRSFQ